MIEFIEDVILYALGFLVAVAAGILVCASLVGVIYGAVMLIGHGAFTWYLPVGLAVIAIAYGVCEAMDE